MYEYRRPVEHEHERKAQQTINTIQRSAALIRVYVDIKKVAIENEVREQQLSNSNLEDERIRER